MATEVKAIPEGFHTLTPSIFVNDGARAIEFYKEALGAQELFRSVAPDGRIMHAELKIGDSVFFLNDEFPDMKSPGQSELCSASPATVGGRTGGLTLYVEDADAWFEKSVAAGAKVILPMMDAFWGDRYGMVVDPFGHTWSFSTHVKDVTQDEVEQAAAQFFSKPCSSVDATEYFGQPDSKAAGN
jgi:uncharacterized glyoxalase superfamily protein PhnB